MAEPGDGELSKENRFSYLLQPIRDLAANWDINIAGELEEYLDELEHLTFTIEGDGGPLLNFAEAALLIQVWGGGGGVARGSSGGSVGVACGARSAQRPSTAPATAQPLAAPRLARGTHHTRAHTPHAHRHRRNRHHHQGTTCVFSKKVEYLHNLVSQALETIFSKKLKEKAAAAAAAAGATAADRVRGAGCAALPRA
jgi:hypothetical protein